MGEMISNLYIIKWEKNSHFLCGKNMDQMRAMMSNLYLIKWEEEQSKYKKEKKEV